MRQTKEEIVDKIVIVSEALKLHLEELKIKDDHLDLHRDIIKLKVHDLKEGLEWLNHIYLSEYTALLKAKSLLIIEQWKAYELLGIDDFAGHQEVVILNKAKVALRKVLVSQERPNMFKKGYVHDYLDQKEHSKKHQATADLEDSD